MHLSSPITFKVSKMAPQQALIQPWKVTDPWPQRASGEGMTSRSQRLGNQQDELRISEVMAGTAPGFVRPIINKTIRYGLSRPEIAI